MKNVKRSVAATVVAFSVCMTSTYAEVAASGGLDVNSSYIFRGGTVNDDVNVTPYLETALGAFTVGAWGNFNTDSEQFDEIDIYVSYGVELGEAVSGSIGYTEYSYPTAVSEDGAGLEADREISVGISLDDILLAPSLTAYIGLEGPFLDEGLYIELSGSHDIALGEQALSAGATLGYEAGDNYEENGFSNLTLSLGTDFGPVAVSIAYVIETDDDVLEIDEDLVVSAGLSF